MYSTQTNRNDRKVPEAYDLVIDEGRTEARRKVRKGKKGGSNDSPWYILGVVGQLGYVIALPIAGGAILGRAIDGKFGTYPRATLAFLMLGILIAGYGFIQTVRDVIGSQNRKELS